MAVKIQSNSGRVKRRLKGWIASSLSLVGRLTLVKSVVNSMAIYPMQHDRIPQGVIEEIEKIQRNFIWGESNGVKMWHAVAWEKMCKPKEWGGVGIKSLKLINEAFLLKLLWWLTKEPNELWAQVLLSKYGRERSDGNQLTVKEVDSRLWKEMVKMWDVFTRNTTSTNIERGNDRKWKLTSDGSFSTKSAYGWLQGEPDTNNRSLWKRIWKIKVPERIRVFMWRCMHKRLLTKSITGKCDASSGQCEICQTHIEDPLHALRDCPYATAIWRKLVDVKRRCNFFGEDWNDWLKNNLQCRGKTEEEIVWLELFAIGCWFIWHWRNRQVHEVEFEVPHKADTMIRQYLLNYQHRWDQETLQEVREEIIHISWKPPQEGWCKLDTDGTLGLEGNAGCGGVIRGDCGERIKGTRI